MVVGVAVVWWAFVLVCCCGYPLLFLWCPNRFRTFVGEWEGVSDMADMALATSSGFGDGGGVRPVPLRGRRTEREGVCRSVRALEGGVLLSWSPPIKCVVVRGVIELA